MAQTNKTKKKQYMAQAKGIHKELTNLLENKNPNILHCVCLLDAEKAALKKKTNQKDVRKLYNDVITVSARDYLLSIAGGSHETKYHIEGAIQRYINWGAMGIVEHLHNKYVLAGTSAH
eukprot:12265330-Ditylum_brightwellii.AAC.1